MKRQICGGRNDQSVLLYYGR